MAWHLRASRITPTFAADLQTAPVNTIFMAPIHTPKATRSTLQNRRLNQALKGAQFSETNGMRLPARRSTLPRAHRTEIALAAVGSGLIFVLSMLAIAIA